MGFWRNPNMPVAFSPPPEEQPIKDNSPMLIRIELVMMPRFFKLISPSEFIIPETKRARDIIPILYFYTGVYLFRITPLANLVFYLSSYGNFGSIAPHPFL